MKSLTAPTAKIASPKLVNVGTLALVAHTGKWDLSNRVEAENARAKLYQTAVTNPVDLDEMCHGVRSVLDAAEAAR